jgi:hypothetical protein
MGESSMVTARASSINKYKICRTRCHHKIVKVDIRELVRKTEDDNEFRISIVRNLNLNILLYIPGPTDSF